MSASRAVNARLASILMLAAVSISSSVPAVYAAPLNLQVTLDKKRFDVERSATASTLSSKEQWGYIVMIENKSFKNLENLEVQYRQYRFDDQHKGAGKLKPVPGSTTIPSLPNAGKFKFETTPIEIEKQELKANWSYRDGSKEKVKDALSGIWLRVLSGSEVIYETQSPASLKQKTQW